jgi:hypothetical protein
MTVGSFSGGFGVALDTGGWPVLAESLVEEGDGSALWVCCVRYEGFLEEARRRLEEGGDPAAKGTFAQIGERVLSSTYVRS